MAVSRLLRYSARFYSCAARETREYNLPTPWGHLAVKEWGPGDGKPVVCLHGWSDNADSFQPLVSLLPAEYRFVAFDFSGHGLSSHRPAGAFYGVLEFVSEVDLVTRCLGLDRFALMGHSMGGRYSMVYDGLWPQRVTKLVIIDVANPFRMSADVEAEAAATLIEETMRYEPGKAVGRTYSREEALTAMVRAGMGKGAAEVLFRRGFRLLEGSGGRVVPSRDPRLKKGMTLVSLACDFVSCINKNCRKDLLLFLTNDPLHDVSHDPDGSFREACARNCRTYRCVMLDGSHTVHAERPEMLAEHVTAFLAG